MRTSVIKESDLTLALMLFLLVWVSRALETGPIGLQHLLGSCHVNTELGGEGFMLLVGIQVLGFYAGIYNGPGGSDTLSNT